jgi:hypothetical protein
MFFKSEDNGFQKMTLLSQNGKGKVNNFETQKSRVVEKIRTAKPDIQSHIQKYI